MFYKQYKLDRFQEEAIKAIEQNHSVIVAAPTGAGKTLIAEYAVEKHIESSEQIIYTAPIKALSNQKYRDFSRDYGDKIGIVTGDVVINPEAPILVMTTEIFRNTIFENVERLNDVRYVIFDEIHYIDDIKRGTVWEESIIFAPQHINFICLSATISNLTEFSNWMRNTREKRIEVISETKRPIPLEHKLYMQGYGLGWLEEFKKVQRSANKGSELKGNPFGERFFQTRQPSRTQVMNTATTGIEELEGEDLIEHIQLKNQLPCLYFSLSRKSCEEKAVENIERDFLKPEERKTILDEYDELCSRYGIKDERSAKDMRELVGHGVAYHHAGLLPTIKEVLERLFTMGYIKLLFTTETFALGINMPACSVVLDSIAKYDGVEFRYLKAREYHQMAGRAGRRGIDPKGFVYACINTEFDKYEDVKKVVSGDIERIESQFNLSYSSILNLYEKHGEGIYDISEKSLGSYQNAKAAEQKDLSPKTIWEQKRNGSMAEYRRQQIKSRLDLLCEFEYINDDGLTPKGKITSRIFGYELQVTESLFDGFFHQLDPDWINVLVMAIVFESKKDCWYREMDKNTLNPIVSGMSQRIKKIMEREKALGIDTPLKELDTNLSTAIYQWGKGCEFDDMGDYTDTPPGDLIRYIRQATDLLRQTRRAVFIDDEILSKLNTCIAMINRDIVDAERQLRVR
jgi:superfamily II RNA helicase